MKRRAFFASIVSLPVISAVLPTSKHIDCPQLAVCYLDIDTWQWHDVNGREITRSEAFRLEEAVDATLLRRLSTPGTKELPAEEGYTWIKVKKDET
jgi:hypothetical protein